MATGLLGVLVLRGHGVTAPRLVLMLGAIVAGATVAATLAARGPRSLGRRRPACYALTMGAQKKETRDRFRRDVFTRAAYRCQGPGCAVHSTPDRATEDLDAHHITDRHAMPGGGYVAENGIALCRRPGGCHEKAEVFHSTGTALPGWSPADLYRIVGSSHERAVRASEKLLG